MLILKNNEKLLLTLMILTILSVGYIAENIDKDNENITTKVTNTQEVSNKKIGWGIKRENNHEQPDLGAKNIKLLNENNGIALGNKESKKIYLTFDEGYEAGYTKQILEILKNENVKATFFITAHYVNTQPELVEQMIKENHIVRKSYCKT